MSEFGLLENGFVMLKEDNSYASTIPTVFYEYYSSLSELRKKLNTYKIHIQCVVSNGFTEDEIAFGETQNPSLEDYANNLDTVAFLLNLD